MNVYDVPTSAANTTGNRFAGSINGSTGTLFKRYVARFCNAVANVAAAFPADVLSVAAIVLANGRVPDFDGAYGAARLFVTVFG